MRKKVSHSKKKSNGGERGGDEEIRKDKRAGERRIETHAKESEL
jgi:hypothetical protein